MTPVQSQALDLLARIFIWTVRLVLVASGLLLFFGIIGVMSK